MGTLLRQPGISVIISQTSEYALRAVVYLAAQGGEGPSVAQDIADATKVPVGYLQKILRMLARAGILVAQRGTGGGFSLTKLPSAISINDVLVATETEFSRIERCPLGLKGHVQLCALHKLLDEQIARTAQVFASTSIADLLASDNSSSPLCDSTLQSPTLNGDATNRSRTGSPTPTPADTNS